MEIDLAAGTGHNVIPEGDSTSAQLCRRPRQVIDFDGEAIFVGLPSARCGRAWLARPLDFLRLG
jgi:hypothetical protein